MAWQSKPHVQELNGERLHLNHGPIDLVLKAFGTRNEVRMAYRAAVARFDTILDECVVDLAELRRPLDENPAPSSTVGRRMLAACRPFVGIFITPMAAVAGAVADEMMSAMRSAADLSKAYVNNGGDIAVYVRPGETLRIGMAAEINSAPAAMRNGEIAVTAATRIGGIATSGAQGRSFSRGIASSVTVLSGSAALADAAATMVANEVDIDSPAIRRQPARELDPDSDLRDILVTTSVGKLSPAEIESALAAGSAFATRLLTSGLISGASLTLHGTSKIVASDHHLILTREQECAP